MLKKIMFLLGLFLILAQLTACTSSAQWGRSEMSLSGTPATVENDLPPFDSVSAVGPFDINFQFVPHQYYINLTGDSALVNHVYYSVNDGTLQVMASQEFEYSPTVRVMITIEVPELKRLHYRGPGKVGLLNLHSDHLILDGEGSSFFYLTGITSRLDATLSGTSRLDARCLKTRTAFINAVNFSQAEVASNGGVSALATDNSDVYYYDSPGLSTGYQRNSGSVLRMAGIAEPPAAATGSVSSSTPTMRPSSATADSTSTHDNPPQKRKRASINYETYSDLNG